MAISARNSIRRYGGIAVILHWAMAILLITLVAMGLYMTRLPDVGYDLETSLQVMGGESS